MQALVVPSIHIISLQIVHLHHIYPIPKMFSCYSSILHQQKHSSHKLQQLQKSCTFTKLGSITNHNGINFSGKAQYFS